MIWILAGALFIAAQVQASEPNNTFELHLPYDRAAPNYFLDFTFDEYAGFGEDQVQIWNGAYSRAWFSTHLMAMNEPTLTGTADPRMESLRFLWLRTFDEPHAVRVEFAANGAVTMFHKRLDGMGGYDPGQIAASEERALTSEESAALREAMNSADTCARTAEEWRPQIDGSKWVFEWRRSNNYCAHQSRSPKSGEFRELGLLLLDFVGFQATDDDPLY